MTKAKSWRWRWAVCLTAALMGSGLGCQPAGNTTGKGQAPDTSKPDKQPDNKDKIKPPKPDIN